MPMTKHIPNMLSILRILLSFLLIPLISARIVFVVVYITIGLTDVLDGLIARKYGYESDLGAKLDSIADFVFYLTLIVIFLKVYSPILGVMHQAALMVIIAIRLINMLLTKIKYKRVVFIHTLANKVAGFIVYLIPMIFLFFQHIFVIWIILMIVFIAAIEELMITVKYKEPDLNRISIFFN
jgi:CDP-diacylglycerol--glycerol-3-phosphate 3-phosphatidyltransferase